MNKKPKLLILVDWFAPGYKAGGPIQSSVNLAIALKNDFEVFVLTADTDHGETLPYPGIVPNKWTNDFDSQISVYYARKATLSAGQIKREMLAVNADFVYLNHMWSPMFVVYPLWLKYVGVIKGKVIVCPRGALYDSALSVKLYKKKPFLLVFKLLQISKKVTFHATNDREKTAILKYFPGARVLTADNLPKTLQKEWVPISKESGSVKCIFIARIVPIKNIYYLLDALSRVKCKVELSIVGPIEDQNYWNSCLQLISQLPANIQVKYKGSIENALLADIVNTHHIFALPTTGENFGHSIFEALLVGRPVLISDQTPWLNLPDDKAGWDLPLNAPEKFTAVIEEVCAWDQAAFDEWSHSAWNYARKFISKPSLKTDYLELFS
ncbi:glycosyltransferase [Segetibacter sp. 3557_3]|uniref:glycosyltransferase family 4 protein n=1 Tax=Segetibacter sp. 3557_3 TaxID=2547429 RepID=UPI0010590D6E|nr:glycosyltransferase [Segetibacter sp. 3557_3]TDH23313.1 glycosyltransferase [Segetibacter sp. 3557_3]